MTRELHKKNKHHGRYDFDELIKSVPELDKYVITNIYDDRTINFFDPLAVKMLNKALLKNFYGISFWDIPENYLCPPIPGRADYIHNIADLLADGKHGGQISAEKETVCLDIGTGANCIYPIIGCVEYGWRFIGSDIDPVAIESARKIVQKNQKLKGRIDLRLQPDRANFFRGILGKDEQIDVSICNPPFHASPEEAKEVAQKKLKNLMQNRNETEIKSGNAASGASKTNSGPRLNFGGQNAELWCPGGEEQFVREMAKQSRSFAGQCRWFSSLIAKKESLKGIYSVLKKIEAAEIKTIPMGQGNKISRIVAWRF